MIRCWLLSLALVGAWVSCLGADTFDRYTNPVLSQVEGAPGAVRVNRITPELALQNRYLSDNDGMLVIARTQSGLHAKLLVKFARQRFGDRTVPIAILDRVTTYKAGQERVLQSYTPSVQLYEGFHFNLELAQVVPTSVDADLRFTAPGTDGQLEPLGKAALFLLTQPLPGTEAPKRTTRPTLSDAFDPQSASGVYRLFDDGRRTARLTLQVSPEGTITGDYVSEQTGRKYDVVGKVGAVKHQLQFTVRFPQSEQSFTAWSFTRDASALAGTAVMQGREFGFYATRVDDD